MECVCEVTLLPLACILVKKSKSNCQKIARWRIAFANVADEIMKKIFVVWIRGVADVSVSVVSTLIEGWF